MMLKFRKSTKLISVLMVILMVVTFFSGCVTEQKVIGIEAEIDYNPTRDASDYILMAYCIENDIAPCVICVCQAISFWKIKRVFSYIAIAGIAWMVSFMVLECL